MTIQVAKLHVLLVSEDKDRAAATSKALSQNPTENYHVVSVRTVDEGCEYLDGQDFDLVMMHMNPDSDRASADLHRLRMASPETPVIAVVDQERKTMAREALEQGVQDVLVGGEFDPDVLSKTVHWQVEKTRNAELRQTLKNLQGNEQTFRKIILENTDGVTIVDQSNKTLFVNPAAEQLLSKRSVALLGKPFLYDLTKDKKLNIELKLGEEVIYVEVDILNITWDGKPAFFGTFRNITTRILLQRRKDDFVSVVSHELRTPMTVIREGLSQVLDGLHGPITDKSRELLSMALEGADRLGRIVDDLLDMAKLEAGKVDLDVDYADVCSVLQDVAATFRPIAAKKRLEVRVAIASKPVSMYIDRGKLIQVFSNLVGNAMKFTEQGGIELGFVDGPSSVQMSVRDTGKGIPEKDLARIFDKFEQVGRSHGPGIKGTGLGLAICRELVDLHAGKIDVQSVLDEGTVFIVTLPKRPLREVLAKQLEIEIEQARLDKRQFSLLRCHYIVPKGEKEAAGLCEQWVKLAVRQATDWMVREESGILLLLRGASRETAALVEKRIRQLFDNQKTRHKPPMAVDLKIDSLTYPDDGTTVAQIARLAD